MILMFTLSMPNIGSWNGKWTGTGNTYCRFRTVTKAIGEELLKGKDNQYFHYDFGDGWSACITVNHVDGKTKQKFNRKSGGFCGYDWMINSILANGEILRN